MLYQAHDAFICTAYCLLRPLLAIFLKIQAIPPFLSKTGIKNWGCVSIACAFRYGGTIFLACLPPSAHTVPSVLPATCFSACMAYALAYGDRVWRLPVEQAHHGKYPIDGNRFPPNTNTSNKNRFPVPEQSARYYQFSFHIYHCTLTHDDDIQPERSSL